MKKIFLLILVAVILALYFLSLDYHKPDKLFYGVSFSRFHSDELKLDWKETYLAIQNDLGVRKFRFSAHWPMVEPTEGNYNFEELDFQIKEAEKVGASVILAVGRRLPGWPECHEPEWVKAESTKLKTESEQTNFRQDKIRKYIETVVNRYKNYENIEYWQVENEAFLSFFSKHACGDLSIDFLDNEIKLVKELDPARPIIVTDSGEFGTWYQAYQRGDVFGTSLYLYVWWRNFIGPLRYPITPAFFRIKSNVMELIYGKKPSMVIELSGEPWLLEPLVDTPIDIQLSRMDSDKFNEMIDFSARTGFDTFYLWGAEWWYWIKFNGHPEFWNRAKELYSTE